MTAPVKSFLHRLRRKQRVLDRHLTRICAEVEKGDEHPPGRVSGILWMDKECATTAIVKLAQVQIKWAELELETLRLLQADAGQEGDIQGADLNEQEYRVLCQALEGSLKGTHPEPSIAGSLETVSQ